MKLRYYSFAAALVVAALAAYALAYPSLPERIATHWNGHGQVDGWSSPRMLAFLGPGLMAMLAAIFAALPWLSPRRFGLEAFEKTYLTIMVMIVAIPGYLFGVVLWAALGGDAAVVPKALLVGICLFTLMIGNLLGKVRRNFYIGIRTPWTLASERTWYATHRFGARTIVAASAGGALLTVLGAPGWAAIAIIGAGFAAPIVYSLLYFKRLERSGELDAAA